MLRCTRTLQVGIHQNPLRFSFFDGSRFVRNLFIHKLCAQRAIYLLEGVVERFIQLSTLDERVQRVRARQVTSIEGAVIAHVIEVDQMETIMALSDGG